MNNLNKKTKLDIKEIVFSNNEDERSFCDTFVYEPENIEEQYLGNLYIVGEVTNLSENSSYILNLLASIIKKEFYSKPKRSILESLELSLHKANSTLADYAEQGNIDWVGNLNVACGAYRDGELHISQAGKVRTLLIRDRQITDIGKDIAKEESPHPFRTFANIASGELEVNDLVLFATTEFFNIFSLEKLRQLSSSLKFGELADAMQYAAEHENNVNAVGVLMMKIKEEKEEETMDRVKIKPVLRVEQILTAEQMRLLPKEELENIALSEQGGKKEIKANKTETDAIAGGKAGRISLEDIIAKHEEREKKEKAVSNDEIFEKPETARQKYNLEKFIGCAFYFFFGFLKKVGSGAGALKRKIGSFMVSFNKGIISKFGGTALKSEKEENIEPPFKANLIKNNKVLLAVFALIFLMLIGNMVFTNFKKKQEEELKFYQGIISQAKTNLDKAEIALINNKQEARKLLAEAKNLAQGVKNDYPKIGKDAAILLDQIQKQADAADLVVRIDSPKVIADLSERTVELKQILEAKRKNYIFDQKDNSLHQIDLNSGKLNKIQSKASGDIGNFKFSVPFVKLGEMAFISEFNKIAVFDASSQEWKIADIGFSENMKSITDAASFSNNLYILDRDSNQIYKHQKISSGFGNAKEWLSKNGEGRADMGNAVSFAIDGNIYVLKSDGKVEKYGMGKKQNFSIESPSDSISSPTRIYTTPDLKHIYITEPQKKRILIFDKTGELVRQYVSSEFDDLKNVIVDDKEEKLYILSGVKIFETEVNYNKS